MMIPDPGSPHGIALGDAIVAYVHEERESIRHTGCDLAWCLLHAQWSASQPDYGHYDHVHVTTTGGGYPKGGEMYLAD